MNDSNRILTTYRPLDGTDQLEEEWLKAREQVFKFYLSCFTFSQVLLLSGLESPERIDNDSIQLIVQHAHRGKHEEIQLGLCSVYISINNQGQFQLN